MNDNLSELGVYNQNYAQIPDDEREEHKGELVARSLNGASILAYARTIDELSLEIRSRYNMRLDEVVVGKVL